MARELVQLLKERKLVIKIAATDPLKVYDAREAGFDAEVMDLGEDENLKKVGIGKDVDTLFCVSVDHHKNLFVALSARHLDPDLKIIATATTIEDEKKMLLAGANRVISPQEIGGHRVYRLIRKPTVFDVMDSLLFSSSGLMITEVQIPKGAFLDGIPFQKSGIEERFDLLVIGIQQANSEKGFEYNTHKVYRKIAAGDILVVIGYQPQIEAFEKALKTKKEKKESLS
ncbi:MAG: hypothetical protein B6D59_03775 [Campylobacteraceae bacterium 4484_4]|nr:MAG: hypothetical protein B6D59_03775 [Campylobacteraceae bacterium 4484_4]